MAYAIGGEANFYEPKDPPGPECQWCDGSAKVDVAAIRDSAGKLRAYNGAVIPCPYCWEEPGVQPQTAGGFDEF